MGSARTAVALQAGVSSTELAVVLLCCCNDQTPQCSKYVTQTTSSLGQHSMMPAWLRASNPGLTDHTCHATAEQDKAREVTTHVALTPHTGQATNELAAVCISLGKANDRGAIATCPHLLCLTSGTRSNFMLTLQDNVALTAATGCAHDVTVRRCAQSMHSSST